MKHKLMHYFILNFLFINKLQLYSCYFSMLIFTTDSFLHKNRIFLTKKARPDNRPCLKHSLNMLLFLVLNSELFNKFVLNITRNKFVCRRRHYERRTSTGE